MAFSPDGNSYTMGHFGPHYAAQRRDSEGNQLSILRHPESVGAIAYGPDGRWLLTGGVGGVYRWDLGSSKLLERYSVQGGNAIALAISPDGQWFVSASEGQAAHLWETATGRRFGPPLPHKAVVVALAVSRNGRLILTGSADKTARLWDAGSGKPLTPPLTHRERVTGVAFLPDGKQVVTASRDHTVQFWELPEPMSGPPNRLRADMEFLTGMELDEHGTVRPLSPSEWLKRRPPGYPASGWRKHPASGDSPP